ncbi:hypothetical protein GCM10025734_13810 [Kitasatospora paranensis]
MLRVEAQAVQDGRGRRGAVTGREGQDTGLRHGRDQVVPQAGQRAPVRRGRDDRGVRGQVDGRQQRAVARAEVDDPVPVGQVDGVGPQPQGVRVQDAARGGRGPFAAARGRAAGYPGGGGGGEACRGRPGRAAA